MRTEFRELLSIGLIDTFRLHEAESGYYSWWDYRSLAFPRNGGLRIDHILATRSRASRCTAARIDREARKGKKASVMRRLSRCLTSGLCDWPMLWPTLALALRLLYGHHWAGRVADNKLSDTSHQEMTQTRSPVRAKDDRIDLFFSSELERVQETLAATHREHAQRHKAQQEAHERIKKHHHTVTAQLTMLKAAIEAAM